MKILIIGSNGQLGFEMMRSCPKDWQVSGFDMPDIDVTDVDQVNQVTGDCRPDWVINCAAYTSVDKAESEPGTAHAVNCDGAANLALAAKKYHARLVHISTDFIFSGTGCRPYQPMDAPAPVSVYGKTKLAGETAVLDVMGKDVLIVRTAWLYSVHGSNFVKTMLRLMNEKDGLSVVDDQVGTPCWAKGLAEVVWAAVEKGVAGVFHWTDAGVASWYDFAMAIQEEAGAAGLLHRIIPVTPVSTEQYPTPAKRPAFSLLDKTSLKAATGMQPRHWRTSLRQMLWELKK